MPPVVVVEPWQVVAVVALAAEHGGYVVEVTL
jgi:hypothetical protein